MTSNNVPSRRVRNLFNRLSMVEACALHQRLRQGHADPETRQFVQDALRKTGLHRAEVVR